MKVSGSYAIKQTLLGTRWKKSVQSVKICVPSFNHPFTSNLLRRYV